MSEALALFGGEPVLRLRPTPTCAFDQACATALHAAIERARTDWSYLSAASGGGPVAEMESRVSEFLGARHVLGVSSGTSALFAALLAGGVGRGDEVIVPAYTWGQSVGPILHVGATPVFADIDAVTYTVSVKDVARRITARTRAIVAVHLFGQPADMTALGQIATDRGLLLIEDAAQAMGAGGPTGLVGTLGNVACFSLGREKPTSGGEGGILVTNDHDLYARAVRLTQHPLRQRYEFGGLGSEPTEFGYGIRIHPMAAVLACSHLASLDERLRSRRRFYARLAEAITGVAGIRPVCPGENVRHAWSRYCPTFVPEQVRRGSVSRERYIQALLAEGVPISPDPIAIPLHRRSFRPFAVIKVARGSYPVAERRCSSTGLALASWLADIGDTDNAATLVGQAFRKVAAHSDRLAPTAVGN